MASRDFGTRVKQAVTRNFDDSWRIYQAFEDKHGFFAGLAAELARRIGLKAGSDVLDVGCGSGISARVLSEQFACRVLGVDLSADMVAAGRAVCNPDTVELVVGDGEQLNTIADGRRFDAVLYNASIFIFPDAARSVEQAAAVLRPGGKIAFSFYPQIVDDKAQDLLDGAFSRAGLSAPKFRTIASYATACAALEQHCGPVTHHRWPRPLDVDFLIDFFSIPAQSASLFPGLSYEKRSAAVANLFADWRHHPPHGQIVWQMAEAAMT